MVKIDNRLKFMKDTLNLIGKTIQTEYSEGKIVLKNKKGIPNQLIDRINNYEIIQVYILFYSILSKHKNSVEKICQDLHICQKTYNDELARALDKLQDYYFNNL